MRSKEAHDASGHLLRRVNRQDHASRIPLRDHPDRQKAQSFKFIVHRLQRLDDFGPAQTATKIRKDLGRGVGYKVNILIKNVGEQVDSACGKRFVNLIDPFL